jgi:hypothetical protein
MSKCEHDPKLAEGPIGMYHCPECGDMVIAGIDHPDMEKYEEEYKKYCDLEYQRLKDHLRSLQDDGVEDIIALMENNNSIKNGLMEIWLHTDFNKDFMCMRCSKETFAYRLYCSEFCEKAQELEFTS